MKNVVALLVAAFATPALAAPLPTEIGLTATDSVGGTRAGAPILPALDLKALTVAESAESTVKWTIETAGSLEAPETGSFKEKLRYRFLLDIDNDGFTGTDWGADFAMVLVYDIAAKKWDCEFERLSEVYSRRMRISPKVAAPMGNSISVEVESALFLTAIGGVWGMETLGDDQVADVIAPDREKPCRIAKGDSLDYDAPERQGVYFDLLAAGATLARPFEVPDRFATIKCRVHIRKFQSEPASPAGVEFFFGATSEPGTPVFSVAPKGEEVVARIGLRGGTKVEELALGKDKPALGRDVVLRIERKGSWLAFFADDQLVGSINAKGLIRNARLLTMKITGADMRSDQIEFTAEEVEDEGE